MDRDLIIRASALYVPIAAAAACWFWRAPTVRARGGMILALAWSLATLVPLQLVAERAGWWSFAPSAGAPFSLELVLGWTIAWGAIPALVKPRPPLWALVAGAAAIDVALMPRLQPVLLLGDRWLVGEVVALVVVLVPGTLLGWWMADERELGKRATLQAVAFVLLVAVLLPALVVSMTSAHPPRLRVGPSMLLVQLLFFAALPGVSAVQEFVERGGGTPIPFDPPTRIVISGAYAYVANPMQLSMALSHLVIAMMLRSWWVAVAGAMSVLYSEGIARWDEERDLAARDAARWERYRVAVRRWIPRWKPFHADDAPPARLYVQHDCAQCSQLGTWLTASAPVGLTIVPAASHARAPLRRITYDPMDGTAESQGVAAVARALEHLSLGWALLGMLARLPLLVSTLQLFADASFAPAAVVEPSP